MQQGFGVAVSVEPLLEPLAEKGLMSAPIHPWELGTCSRRDPRAVATGDCVFCGVFPGLPSRRSSRDIDQSKGILLQPFRDDSAGPRSLKRLLLISVYSHVS